MAIKFSSELEKSFRENDRRIRTWPTWKLKCVTLGQDSQPEKTIWDRMSKHDQEFNLVWNAIEAGLFCCSLTKLRKILAIIRVP
jgi:hypothetical protein